MRAVHFGAGAIGRGFIGELLHDSGYDITFIDVSEELVNQINKTNSYELYLINHNYEKKLSTMSKHCLQFYILTRSHKN